MNSPRPNKPIKLGRVVIDERGISQRPLFFLFGESFSLRWSEITSWSTSEMVVASKASGDQSVASQVLELHSNGKIHFITRSGDDEHYKAIVNEVRDHIPEKETSSILTTKTIS